MIKDFVESSNFTAFSEVSDKNIASMSASYSTGGETFFRLRILDKEMYNTNKEAFDSDFQHFKDAVINKLSMIKEK
jgi:hypothetical protein